MFTIERDIRKAFQTFFFDMSWYRNVYQHKETHLFSADIYVEFEVFRYSFSEAIPIFFNRFFPCLIYVKFSTVIGNGLKL